MTLDRLQELLDAYGAAVERWPETERLAAQRLLAVSADARALLRVAAELDGVLDTARCAPPSPELAARVLAAAPKSRVAILRPRRLLLAAVPLAAAATVALWLTTREVERTTEALDLTGMELVEYTSPTDVLLAPYGVDVYTVTPAIGCSESTLGCPKMQETDQSESRLPMEARPTV